MFCTKCGQNLPDNSTFCTNCGSPTTTQTAAQAVQPSAAAVQAPIKKKSKKLLFGILGIVALIAVISIIIAVSIESYDGEPNLFQIAENVSPLTDEGFDATYGDVFKWLMTNRGTRLVQQGDIADLTYSGKVTGGDYPVSVVLRITGLGLSNARVFPRSMTLNGIEVPNFTDRILIDLFWAQDNKKDYPTFMDFVRWDNENASGTFRRFLEGKDGRIVVDETQTFDGRTEVTLHYVEFHDSFGRNTFPEDGFIFLKAEMTVKNIGTEEGGIANAFCKVVYDDVYEYGIYPFAVGGQATLGEQGFGYIRPLTPPVTASMVFEVPRAAAEFDKSLVINIAEGYFGKGETISFVIRPGSTGNSSVFKRVGNGSQSSAGKTNISGQICFRGKPITYLLDSTIEEIYDIFGNPTYGTPIDGQWYSGGEIYGYDDIAFVTNYETGRVVWILLSPDAAEVDGITLDKTRMGLVSILGEPIMEYYDEDSGYNTLQFLLWDNSQFVVASIAMNNSNGKARNITIWVNFYD